MRFIIKSRSAIFITMFFGFALNMSFASNVSSYDDMRKYIEEQKLASTYGIDSLSEEQVLALYHDDPTKMNWQINDEHVLPLIKAAHIWLAPKMLSELLKLKPFNDGEFKCYRKCQPINIKVTGEEAAQRRVHYQIHHVACKSDCNEISDRETKIQKIIEKNLKVSRGGSMRMIRTASKKTLTRRDSNIFAPKKVESSDQQDTAKEEKVSKKDQSLRKAKGKTLKGSVSKKKERPILDHNVYVEPVR